MAFAPAYPHGSPQPIADDVFVVRGSIKMNPIIRISRNMVVIRHGGELTLVNPIRLSGGGLAELDGLGKVTNLLRLGAFHGLDDPFYMQRYQPTFWSQTGGTTYTKPNIDRELSEGCELPFPGATFFAFEGTIQPEGAIVLDKGAGLLLTTDAIQHYGDFSYSNFPARVMLPLLGFSKTTLVGPIWLKFMTPEGASLKDNFTRLLQLPFDSVVAAHGTLLADGGHAATTRAVQKAFSGA